MPLKDELISRVSDIMRSQWTTRNGTVVPDDKSIGLGNDGVTISAAVLYADLADSTKMVDAQPAAFAAEVYKSFLHCASRIITSEGGVITAFDGDRVMSVFLGDTKCSTAARAALKINWATKNIVQPAIQKQYPNKNFQLRHVCGIDTSQLLVAKTGIRGSNDLVWVGRSANYAAKLSALSESHATRITASVYESLHASSKYSNGKDMWEPMTWNAMSNIRIYRSSYWWSL